MTTVPDAELLYSHAGFLRNVARSLLLDDQQADDVVQQTLLAALEKPPQHTGNLKAWLATVTRNLALMRRRGEGRRRRREESVARPERDPVPTPDEVHARLEMQRRVVDAVMDLREPYKSAVVFRYLDELRPEEIAERLDVPVGTVKSRLKRGLAILRERFDDEVDGGRQAWRLALLPLVVPMATAQAATATATAAAITTTGLLSMKTTLSLAAVLILALVLLMTQAMSNSDDPARTQHASETDRGPTLAAPEVAGPSPSTGEEADRTDEGATIPLRAIVRDEAGQPVPGVRILSLADRREATSNADGRFEILTARVPTTIRIGMDEHGYAMVELSKAGYVRKSVPLFTSASRPKEQVFVLQRGAPLGVRVVDGAGNPVPNALVKAGTSNEVLFFDYGMMRSRYPLGEGVTDADGRMTIPGAPLGELRLNIAHDAWAAADRMVRLTSLEQTEVEVVLSLGGAIEGRITKPDGKPHAGALVHLDDGKGRSTTSGEDGSYRIDRVKPGEHTVWVSAEGFGPGFFGHALGWGQPAEVRARDGVTVRDIDIPLMAATMVRGRLLNVDGDPLVGVQVRVFGRDWDAAFSRRAKSDAEGRFVVGPLPVDRPRALAAAFLADGYRFIEKEFRVTGAGDSRDLGDVKGFVVGRISGTTAPGAVVRANSPSFGAAGESETYADREGKFTIAAGPGQSRIHARRGGNSNTGLSATLTIKVPEGEVVKDIELPLREVGSISGRLMNSAGHGRAFHKLGAVPADAEAPYEKMQLAWTNATGDFRFDNLGKGRWRVGLVDRHHFNPSTFEPGPEPRVIETGATGVEFTIPGEKTLIRGRVVSARDGTPVSKFRVKFLRYKFFVPQDWLWSRYTNEDGRFAFDRATPGTWAAEVEAEGFAPLRTRTFSVKANGDIDLGEVRLGDPGGLRGQIKDAAGAPVAYARIHALNAQLQSNDDNIPFTDADGRFSIGGLAPGVFTLFVVSPRHPLGIYKNVMVRQGETNELALVLDPASPVLITVTDESGQPVDGAQLIYTFPALQPLNSSMVAEYEPPGFGSNYSNAKGEIRKPFMAAGTLVVQIVKDGYRPASTSVTLVAGEAARVTVTLQKSS